MKKFVSAGIIILISSILIAQQNTLIPYRKKIDIFCVTGNGQSNADYYLGSNGEVFYKKQ
jgi:hypothetical protein